MCLCVFDKERGRIKSVSWEYSYDEEYLEESNKGKNLKHSLSIAVFPRNRLDPKVLVFALRVYIGIASFVLCTTGLCRPQ